MLVLDSILFMLGFFIFNVYCVKDMLVIFILILIEDSGIVIENLSYIGRYEFFGIIVMFCY